MFVKRVKKENGAISVRIVESIRYGEGNKKIAQKNIKIVGQAKREEDIQALERAATEMILQMESSSPSINAVKKKVFTDVPEEILLQNVSEIKRVNDGIFDIFGSFYDEFDLNEIIEGTNKDDEWNKILKAMVLSRIASPESKRRTSQILFRDYLINVPLEKFYRTMDRVVKFEEKAQQKILEQTKKISGGKINVMLFDVTTLYFESMEPDDLRNFGFSKDLKFKEVQVVLSLITTEKGFPVGYRLFPGNTAEGKTLIENILQVKKRLEVSDVTLIADRAMFTEENLALMESLEIQYIVAAKLKSSSKEEKEKFTKDLDYTAAVVGGELHWSKDYQHKGRRLIVSYSSTRATRDKYLRERLIERILKKSKDGKVNLNEIIGNTGTKKYIKSNGKKVEINQEKILEESNWDGLHGIITNITKASSTTLLSQYRNLWKIEEAFRINKHDLKMRPIYHWKKERIEAHILICYMAFALSKFTLARLDESLGESKSLKWLVNQLSKVESSIVNDTRENSKSLFVIPSKLNVDQQKIYQSLGLERKIRPWVLV